MDAKNINYYWETVHKMLDCAGSYMRAVQLRDNLKDPETAWKVQRVLDDYYDGKISKIDIKITNERAAFNSYINRLNNLCKRNGLQTITKPEKLFELLCDSKHRNYYRQRANRYLDKGTVVSLQDIEQDFLSRRKPH